MEKDLVRLSLNSQIILDKKFSKETNGYNALHVDEFLDRIIKDYKLVESNCLMSKQRIDALNEEINKLKKENERLAILNASYASKLEGIKDASKVNSNNIELLQKISALEKRLWKEGIDPSTIK